ncbi:hypothetical protein [Oceanicola sp. 502str15]|uniref:hypothetical protein n=1 Tax=Oceanicola sp. 502str15 TaxID=2696061 RepID=UPI002094F61A|nr:hypothetical protein [Oceanicola sp. 502str15]MCO6385025.1 hypothetical protein [Oceanicola sp. 502str15]
MDRKTRNAHSCFAPYITGEIHPTRAKAARQIVNEWMQRTGEFVSLSWSDRQISEAMEIGEAYDNGFTQMLIKVLDLRDGRGPLPV